jgi:tetratricopeptide (TPR) repeat protein
MLTIAIPIIWALAQSAQLQVSGEIVSRDKVEFRQAEIESIDRRFVQYTDIDSSGKFLFKKIPEGLYKVMIMAEGAAEQRTIEVRRVLADARGTVAVKIELPDKALRADKLKVGVGALGVSPKAVEELQHARDARGDVDKARRHLEKAIAISPNFDDALNNLGTLYYTERKYDKAAELFERALHANPNSFVARVNLGGALISLGLYDRALVENLKAIEMRPGDSLAQSQTGQTYFYLMRYDEALTHLETAKRIDPMSFTLPGVFIAGIREIQGERGRAIEEYKEFLKVHPGHPQTPFVEAQLRRLQSP